MKISGVISEFNPFHNGHKYLLNKIRENSDAVVCVMSGSFVQRGDIAIFDKWTRAKSALLNGADLIIELPAVFSSSAAERFAYGAVELISSLGCVNELWFGSESGNIEEIKKAGRLLNCENMEISDKIKKNLDSGMGFPAARQKAYQGIIKGNLFKNPNNILAVEYIKALEKQRSSVKPVTVQRIGTGYHDTHTNDIYASASALRYNILNGINYYDYVPDNVCGIYKSSEKYNISNLNNTIFYLLRTKNLSELKRISGVSEGLEYRLKELSRSAEDIEKLVDLVSTKRYSKTRIRRIITSLLLGITHEMRFEHISYVRVLGFNDLGRKILKIIKEKSELPLIIKTADYKENNILFQKDILSTDIASMCADNSVKKTGGRDFTTPPVYVKLK